MCVRKSSCEMEMSRVKGQNCKFDCHISCQSPCPLYSLYPSDTYTNMHTHTIRPATLPAIHSNLQDNQSACSVLFCFVSFPHFLFFFFFSWITARSNVQLLKSRQLRYLTDFLLGSTPDRGWHNFWYNLVVGAQCVCNRDHFKSQHTVPTGAANVTGTMVVLESCSDEFHQKWLPFNYFVPMWQKSIAKTVGVRG